MILALLGGSILEHVNGVCKQCATNCLMATYTHCLPGAGVHDGGSQKCEHTSIMLDRAEQTGKTVELVLAIPT